jgi:hypothetical protein
MKKLAVLFVAMLVLVAVPAMGFTYFGDVKGSGGWLSGVQVLVYQKAGDGSWQFWGDQVTGTSTEYSFDLPVGEFILQFVKDGWKSQLYNGSWGAYDIPSALVINSPGGLGQQVLPDINMNPQSVQIEDFYLDPEIGGFVAEVSFGLNGSTDLPSDGFLLTVTFQGQAHDSLQMVGEALVGRKATVIPLGTGKEIVFPFVVPGIAPRTTMNAHLSVAHVPRWVARVYKMNAVQRAEYFRLNGPKGKTPEAFNKIISESIWHTEDQRDYFFEKL